MIVSPGKMHRKAAGLVDIPSRPVDLPTVASVVVPALSPTNVVISFNVGGTPPILPASSVTGFVVKVAGIGVTVNSASRTSEFVITLVLALPIVHAAVVTLDYAPGNVTDSASSALASFSGLAVTNLV